LLLFWDMNFEVLSTLCKKHGGKQMADMVLVNMVGLDF
jgi:hypothetical protein